MRGRHKPKGDKRQNWAELEAIEKASFSQRLAAAADLAGAHGVVIQAVPLSAPGRELYTNLESFLQLFGVPPEADQEELRLYRDLMHRVIVAGGVPTDVAERAIDELTRAIDEQASSAR